MKYLKSTITNLSMEKLYHVFKRCTKAILPFNFYEATFVCYPQVAHVSTKQIQTTITTSTHVQTFLWLRIQTSECFLLNYKNMLKFFYFCFNKIHFITNVKNVSLIHDKVLIICKLKLGIQSLSKYNFISKLALVDYNFWCNMKSYYGNDMSRSNALSHLIIIIFRRRYMKICEHVVVWAYLYVCAKMCM